MYSQELKNKEIQQKREIYKQIAKLRRLKGDVQKSLRDLEINKTIVSRSFYEKHKTESTELLQKIEKQLVEAELLK